MGEWYSEFFFIKIIYDIRYFSRRKEGLGQINWKDDMQFKNQEVFHNRNYNTY